MRERIEMINKNVININNCSKIQTTFIQYPRA